MAPPKRPWFRFYVEAVHDRKLRRLKPETRWLFVACLAAARQSPTPGHLLVAHTDPMVVDDLMDFAGMTRKQIEDGMDALMDSGVVAFDRDIDTWFIPNWKDRQYESDDVTTRTRKHRSKTDDRTVMERSKNGDGTSDGTPPETETETEPFTSVGSPTVVVPSAAVPINNRLSEPSSFVEIVEPGGRVAVLHEAGAILDAVDKLATERLLPDERRKLRPVVADALKAGYDPRELAEAIVSSPFRTQAGVIGELRKRKQPQQTRKSVGDTGLAAAASWLQRQEGA